MIPLESKMPKTAGEVDYNESLETVIGMSEGDTTKTYLVTDNGKAIGLLDMKVLVKALVPRAASEAGVRGAVTS